MYLLIFSSNIGKTTYDILRRISANLWGGVKGVKKASKILKGSISISDVTIYTNYAFEDFSCQNSVCKTLENLMLKTRSISNKINKVKFLVPKKFLIKV